MALACLPLTSAQFDDWRTYHNAEYAKDKVNAGNWSPAEAPQRAAASFDQVWTNGPETAGQVVRRVEDQTTGELIGWFWVGTPTEAAPGTGWLYDIEIVPEHRGRGHGRAFMTLAEEVARQLGFTALGLHVFAHNTVARRLYESSGYTITNLNFAKKLA